jgi:predicted dehydrogenase
MTPQRIRVGIIGAGVWTTYGHIPALQSLPEFEVTAVAARSGASAQRVAAQFGIARVHDEPHALIADPDVDLVAVLTPAPQHARFAKAAIDAAKDVYSEWPLTTSTADSQELLALAEAKGVRHLVGLQRRVGPSARYARDLVAQGYVGQVRGARLLVGTEAFVPTRSERHAWTFDVANFSNILSIYVGHHLDTLLQIVGPPTKLTGVTQNHFPLITVAETGEQVPTSNPDAVAVIGTLERGGLLSVHVEGGQQHQTGLLVEVTGTNGVLRLANPLAFANPDDNTVEGVTGDATALEPLPVPAEYRTVRTSTLDESVLDLAHLYATYARDKTNDTMEAPTFRDGVRLHQMIDQIARSSDELFS